MKKLLMIAVGFLFVLSGSSFAFHDDGVAHCNGCHTMHNSFDGALVDPDSPDGNAWLLVDATPSDVCLSCHSVSGSRGVFAADPLAPNVLHGGGDFVFLTEDLLQNAHGHTQPGDRAGHNINAPSKLVGPDATLTTAPGAIGTPFPSSSLGCSSCHDPHGNQNFRLLYGIGGIQDGAFTFTAAAPVAQASSSAAEANDNHTAYISGMSAWCGNCHGDFHANPGGKLIHPAGQAVGGTIATAYGLYNGSDDITGGTPATSYLAAVPFEDAANTPTSTAGPTATSKVMCLTCHRAHASSGPSSGRWDFNETFLTEDGLGDGSYPIPNPYSVNQRSLCNKCHTKDVGDAPFVP
jgi:hypothetical protein